MVLLDEAGRVLLFRWDSRDGTRHWWILPGGGINAGETAMEAARRELLEECGLEVVAIGPEIWQRSHRFTWDGRDIAQHERIFLVRVPSHEVDVSRHEPHETEVMSTWRWWTAEEIAVSSDEFAPRRLAALLAPLLAGQVPPAPIDVGV